jgi:hypothetical protein
VTCDVENAADGCKTEVTVSKYFSHFSGTIRQPGIVRSRRPSYFARRSIRPASPSLEFAVPFALIIFLLDITLIYHASRTGRLQPWAFIILMIPGIGALVYILVELVPEMLSGPGAQQARRRVANRLDPENCIGNYPIGSLQPTPLPTVLRSPLSV